jgi:hypothetical protein
MPRIASNINKDQFIATSFYSVVMFDTTNGDDIHAQMSASISSTADSSGNQICTDATAVAGAIGGIISMLAQIWDSLIHY